MSDQEQLNQRSYVLPGGATVTVQDGAIREEQTTDESGNPKKVLVITPPVYIETPAPTKKPGPTLKDPVFLEYRVKASDYQNWYINGEPAPREDYWRAFGIDPKQPLTMNIPATLKVIVEVE